PTTALSGEHTGLVAVGDALVLAEQVADLSHADPDVTGRHVRVLTDVPVELGHEGLAETHDLGITAPPGVEVGTPFCTAERQPGQRVFEDLFEAQELHDPDVDRRVEAQTSLVGAQRRAELHPETTVDLDLAVVIDPWHSEDDLPLRL